MSALPKIDFQQVARETTGRHFEVNYPVKTSFAHNHFRRVVCGDMPEIKAVWNGKI